MVPLNVLPRWRMFNQLSRACRPHRSWKDVNSSQPLLHSQGPQHHFVKLHRVESWLFPGEEVAAEMPDVPFPQQLVEGPSLPGWGAASAETKPRKSTKFPQTCQENTKLHGAWGNTGWQTERYSGLMLPPTSFVSVHQCLKNLFKELFQVFSSL